MYFFWVPRFLNGIDKESDKIAIKGIKTYEYELIWAIFHIKKAIRKKSKVWNYERVYFAMSQPPRKDEKINI